MEPTPEWIVLIAPFVSGAAGVGITAGAAWGVMKQRYVDLERRVSGHDRQLEKQVGEPRCDKMREACQTSIAAGLSEIKAELKDDRKWLFDELARFLSQNVRGEK